MSENRSTVVLHGVELDVQFEYTKPCRGTRNRYGVPLEPDEPESFEILEVLHMGEDIIDLISEKDIGRIIDRIQEEA